MQVGFELINEPGTKMSDLMRFGRPRAPPVASLLADLVQQVHAAQPTRVVIVAGEQYARCDEQRAQSREAVIFDAKEINQFVDWPGPVVATFHYYDPREFTSFIPDVTDPEKIVFWNQSLGWRAVHEAFAEVNDTIRLPGAPHACFSLPLFVRPLFSWHRPVLTLSLCASVPRRVRRELRLY